MKDIKKFLCLCFALCLTVMLFTSLSAVYAASSLDIDVESRTELHDNYMDAYGWLSVTAYPPDDFDEILCLELYNASYGTVSFELNPFDFYIAGEWLHNGTYTVTKACVIGNDEILVESNLDEVVISHDEDVYLTLSLVEPEIPEPTEELPAENIVTESTASPSELPVVSETTTETEGIVIEDLNPPENEKPNVLFICVVIGMAVVLLVPCLFVYLWYKRNQE